MGAASLQQRAEAELELRRRQQGAERPAPMSFREFVRKALPRLPMYWHVEAIITQLQRVADEEINRLMLFAPPRHYKSLLVSRLFPAYMTMILDNHQTMLVANTDRLANRLAGDSRQFYKLVSGGRLEKDANHDWRGSNGSGMLVAGMGGNITGFPSNLGIIDDPLTGAKEAASQTVRESQQDWYQGTFYSRLEPGAAIIFTVTRWNEDDLAGFLLSQEGSEDAENENENWTILSFQAIRDSADDPQFPPSCEVIPDPRPDGEALCPERYPVERLRRIKARVGAYYWSALYQQRPTAASGGFFRRENFRYYHMDGDDYILKIPDAGSFIEKRVRPSDIIAIYQTVDPAGTKEENSAFFVCLTFAITREYDLLYLDVFREKTETTRHQSVISNMFAKWRPFKVAVERQSYGLNIIQYFVQTGLPIVSLDADRSKELRAEASQIDYENGKIYHRTGAPWLVDLEKELLQFPNGKYKDQVDCGAYASLLKTQVWIQIEGERNQDGIIRY